MCLKEIKAPLEEKNVHARAVANADHQNALSKASAFFVIFSLVGPRPDASRRTKQTWSKEAATTFAREKKKEPDSKGLSSQKEENAFSHN